MDSYSADKKTLSRYFVFVAIVCFPLGLISGLAYLFLYGNNVKVEEFNYVKITDVAPEEKQEEPQTEEVKEEQQEEPVQEETEEEKLEKLKKLENFKEKGIISEEEFEMAKEQMFGKKDA
jgi:flagellar biosynthesis component FlhA